MKKFKRLLAMFLVVTMVVGIVNLPARQVEAADKQATLSLAASPGGTQDDVGLRRYVINFDVSGATISGGTWNNNTVYIDGVAKSGDGVNYLYDSGVLTLYLTYEQVEAGKTSADNIGKHSLVIKKGTVIGDTEITADVAVVLDARNINKATPIQLSYVSGSPQDGSLARYALNFTANGATGLGDTYWNNNTVYIGERPESGEGVNYLGSGTTLSLYLTYAHIQNGAAVHTDLSPFTLTIADGTIFGNGPTNYLVSTATEQLEINQAEISEVVVPDATVSLENDSRNNANCTGGFYFVTSPAETLPSSESWQTRYAMTTGGIYHNDTIVPGARLVKILNNLYYVAFDGCGITFVAGDKVKIDGTVKNNDYIVKYEAQMFVYDGNGKWEIYTEPTGNNFTIADYASGGRQEGNSRWLFRFNTTAAIPGGDFAIHMGDKEIKVFDGTSERAVTASFYSAENNALGMIVSYSDLPSAAAGYRITIPADTTLVNGGTDYVLTEAITFEFDSAADTWKKYVEPADNNFTITGYAGGGAQDFNNPPRWLLQFATTKAIEGTGYAWIATRDVKIQKLGGTESTVQVEYCTLGDGKLTLLIPFTDLPQAAEGYVVTIPAGTIGTYELTEDYAIQYSAGEWIKYEPSAPKTQFTITGLGIYGAQPDMNRWLLRLNTSVEISGDAYATLVALPTVMVDTVGTTVELYPNEEKGLAMILPFAAVPETPAAGTTVTIPAGFYGDYELTKDFAMYYDNGAWNEKIDESGIQAEKVTFSYFANRDDVLALNIDKIANTLPGEAEPSFTPVGEAKITYNGVQTKNPKMSQFGMYLAVADMTNGAQAKAKFGDKITISGIWKYTGDNKFYDFGTVTYRYNGGGAWEVFDPSQDVAYDMATPKIYDMFELTNLSTVTMREGSQFNLADLKASTNVGMKLMVNSVPGDVIFTLSKDVANNVWVNSGYEIKLVPDVNEIRIITIEPYSDGREDEVIRARVSNMDFGKPFALEFSVADMYKKGTKQLIGRCVIAKVNGEEVIRWIDKDLNRKLGHYSAAWAAKETTIDSIGYKGYVPVDKNVGVTDFFDATGYAEKRVTPNECSYLGELGSKNKALKMNVDMTKTTGEFKIALAKKDQTTIWDIDESGYQFWFRPETNQVFIGYGMSEYATMVSHECSGRFVLEIGSKDVYHQNGKYYGYMVYVKIDGKEVTSWVDDNIKNRNMGTAIVAYGSADADVVLSTLYNTYELPVVYNVNGEEQDSSDFASVQSKVVLNKPSKITITTKQDAAYAMKYEGTFLGEEELKALEIANTPIGVYTYEATAAKGDRVVVKLQTKELTTDEPTTILDIADVMGMPSIEVESSKDAHVGSTVSEKGRHRINTAVQMKVEIPESFNQIRWSMFSDQSSMWGYNGFIVKLLNNKIAICYTATERKLAEFNCDLVKPNTTLYIESGAVKCYENGNYKYDRYYVKVGETLDSMELACWFDSRERGSYGTTISAYGMDVPGSYTISSVKDMKTITDVSTQANKEKLATNEAFDTINYAVYYPSSVNANSSAAIKLYTKDGMNLKSLTVAGKNVIADVKKTDDGCYVYDIPKVTSDIKFSYVIE